MNWINVEDQPPPRDGTPFLCYDPRIKDNFPNAVIYVVVFSPEDRYGEEAFKEAGRECYFEWTPTYWTPTHWMPLPPPPTS